MTATRLDKALAEELQADSRSGALHPQVARLIKAAASHILTEDDDFQLLDQLGAMKRVSLPSIDALVAKPVDDHSTQDLRYRHAISQRGWANAQFQDLHDWFDVTPGDSTAEASGLDSVWL